MVQIDQSLISLAPLETITIFFMVCLVTGLVLASPWVFYQVWAFVAAGLYRHERHYVKKFLPISLGLFLAGVFLCFWFVLPITLGFLLEFNVWLGVEPTLRLSRVDELRDDPAAGLRPRFQTPADHALPGADRHLHGRRLPGEAEDRHPDHPVAAAVLTPGQDPFSMLLLAVPMILLYELGILLIGRRQEAGRGDLSRRAVLRPHCDTILYVGPLHGSSRHATCWSARGPYRVRGP